MVKRSSLNVNFWNIADYAFIDHVLSGDQYGPFSTEYAATTDPWNKNLDANGWPNHVNYDNRAWGVGVRIPASTDFAGPYVLTWPGDGEVDFPSGTWAIDTGLSSGYSAVNTHRWTGTNARIVVNYTGARLLFTIKVLRTDRSANGSFLKNLKFYRLEDEADLLAGKIFRAPYKQTLADLNPSALRFMNWTGRNDSKQCRFEHRTLPGYASYSSSSNWVASPAYPESTGTNAIEVASATGMPVAMQNGEVVTCRIGNTIVRHTVKAVTAITKANPGVVTATAHGFQTGDVIVHQINAGMVELDYKPVTITVIDPDTYSIGVDTTGFTTFTASGGSSDLRAANQYITLNVGGRGAYPVVFGDGVTPAGNFGAYIADGEYKTFTFDKDLVASTDVTGAWIFTSNGTPKAFDGSPPLEVCTALINELMEMTRTDGGAVGPVDMWITIPHRGLLSVDQDYSAGSNWPVNACDVILNGANGYDGLNASCKLIVEMSNETWNTANSDWNQTFYFYRRGYLRWPASGRTDASSFSTLRSVIMVNDIKTAFPAHPQLKFALCGQGTLGISGLNSARIAGTTYYDGDVLNIWGGDPMDHFDYFGWAGYFVASSAFDTANLATYVASWLAAATAEEREAVCALYVVGIIGVAGSGQTTARYGDTLLPAYATEMAGRGKTTVMYEGGWDRAISGSADTQNFLTACKQSRAWANALTDFFNKFDGVADSAFPADYIQMDQRWGHAYPDMYSGGVEGAGLDLAWRLAALRNRGKRQFLIKT